MIRSKLIVISHDYRPKLGGVATCTYELVKHLQEQFFDVLVVAPQIHGADDFDRQQGFQTLRLDLPRSATRAIPKYLQAIKTLNAQEKPDAFLHMLWHPSAIAQFLVQKFIRTPYFVTVHGVEMLESHRNIKKRLRSQLSFIKKSTLRSAHSCLAVSNFTAQLIADCHVPREKIFVVKNGVDPKSFYAKTSIHADHETFKGRKILLTVSRLVPHKGIDVALQAVSKLATRHPEILYLVGGIGPDAERLRDLTRDLKITDHVHFLGEIPSAELNEYYNLCDIYLMLSRLDPDLPAMEGFGIAFLEAGACEKPVIAGKSGGTSSAVMDGETGYLVPPQDSGAVIEKVDYLLTHPLEARGMGLKARQYIETELSWSHVASNVATVIQKGIERP